ncbi:MAG: hypothetical protein IPK60_16320 [Sandaracinaceae bacterium]|nr:hypothetical protein [Sandaracinaceae bacterium]
MTSLHTKTSVALAVCTALLGAGCAHQAGAIGADIARQATPTAIESSLRSMDEEENQRRLAHILESPQIQIASERLVARVTDGTLNALSDEARAAKLAEFAHAFAGEIGSEMREQMRVNITPEIVSMVGRTVDASISHALSEGNQDRIAEAVANIARQSVSAVAAAFMEEVRPQIRAMLREDLMPAMRETLNDPQLQQAIGATTRTLTAQVVLGMQDAFEQIDVRHERGQGRDTILTELQEMAQSGTNMVRWAAIGLAGLAVLLIAWLLRTRAKANAAAKEADRREAALLVLAQAIKSTEGQPWSPELRSVLKEAFRDNEHGDYIRQLLRKQQNLRLGSAKDASDIFPPAPQATNR